MPAIKFTKFVKYESPSEKRAILIKINAKNVITIQNISHVETLPPDRSEGQSSGTPKYNIPNIH
jgi:transposase